MSFFVYFFVLLVAASSVLFGLDWMQAPLQAPVQSEHAIHAAPAPVAPVQKAVETPPSKAVDTTAAAVSAETPVVAGAGVPAATVPAHTADAAETTGTTDALTMQAKETADAKPPLCDIAACERAYHTFTPADCTYQPYEGARRLCTKGAPPGGHAALLAANESRAQARCNVSACSGAYSSFDAATCTYQPYDGPRRLCTK